VFSGENYGLVIAEIELRDAHQPIELPPWIGREITGQPQYYNSSLVQRPFCSWSQAEAPLPVRGLPSRHERTGAARAAPDPARMRSAGGT
jgi:hypothetical protein